MASATRCTAIGVNMSIEQLQSSLDEMDFISCLRRIDCQNRSKPRQGHAVRPSDEVVRLSQRARTSFHGRALDSIEARNGLHDYRLFCNFLGLFGTNGPLPLHLTEYADQRVRHHQDPAFAAFVDLFNHRMLSLFYRATADLDPSIAMDRPEDNGLEAMAAALGGYLPSAGRHRDDIPDYTKFFHAGWMGGHAKSPDGIKALVMQYFEVQTGIDEFTGGWLTLPDSAHTVIGQRSQASCLGVSTYLGRRAWSVGHKFTLVLGPLGWDEYLSFQPGGQRARSLYQLMKNYLGDEWDWDVKLVIAAGKVKGFGLDKKAVLGFSSFLGLRSGTSRSATREICLNRRVLRGE